MRWLAATLVTCIVLALPASGHCQTQAEKPDPLVCAIPPQSVFAAVADLRPETESMKALVSGNTPEQLAVIRAAVLLGLQQMLAASGTDLDVEKDVLPWVTRRAALCFVPIPGKKDPGVSLLIETQGGTPAAACIERLAQAGVKSKQLEPLAAIDGVPVWRIPKLAKGVLVAYVDPVLVLSFWDGGAAQVVKHLKGVRAGGAISPTAQALLSAPPGMVRFGVAPHLFANPQNPGAKALALTGVCGAARYTPEGGITEVAIGVNPQSGPWPALAGIRPTFSESVAGIPASAVAVVAMARPSVFFHGLGLPITDAIAAGMVGPPPLKAIGKGLAPILSDVLGQEVALALVPEEGQRPTWLAVFTSARPTAFGAMVNALIQSSEGAKGIAFMPAPLGEVPAWTAELTFTPDRPPLEAHLAVVEARLLAAGSRKALEAGVATLTRRAGSVATAEWYAKGTEALGPNPLVKGAVSVAGVSSAFMAFMAGRFPLPPKYAARLMDALSVGVRQMTVGIRLDGNTLRVVAVSALDYPKMAALGGTLVPGLVSLGMMAVADQAAKAKRGAEGDAPAQACLSQMRELCLAAHRYAADWGKLPRAEGWSEALEPYLKDKALLHCPADGGQHVVSYAFNRALAEIPIEQIANPAKTILFYECVTADASPSGTGEGLPDPPRHQGKHVFGFADGHVVRAATADPAWWGKK